MTTIEKMAEALKYLRSVLLIRGYICADERNSGVRIINKALQDYEAEKDEYVTISRSDYTLLMAGTIPSNLIKLYNAGEGE